MKNLTSGNIRSQLMFLALPLIAGNMLQQFYHTIDALVIGRFAGPAAFAAIGVSGTVMNLFIFVINGFCTGISIILAQFYGRGDQRGFCREFFTSLASGCVFTAAISILGIMSLSGVLQMIGTPAEVAAPAQAYLVIIFCGLMTTFLYNFCSAVLRAAGDTRAALFSWRLRCVPTWRWTLCLWRCFTEALPGQGGPPYSPREFPCCSASYT